MLIKANVKRNTYFDSITLMKVARFLGELPGIEEAAAIMATEPNLQLLAEAGLTPPEGTVVRPADVLFVVRAGDEGQADAALAAAEEQLVRQPSIAASEATGAIPLQPRSLEEALRRHPKAGLVAISVPGPYATLESERALRQGLHVFLFSDNVPLEDEIALKQLATERDLLLMGPDCGTAQFQGVGLGFVNVVPAGPIGIVGASGTGIQQVMSLIAQQGGGVSQVIGCGGRDLSEAVGARTTLQGLQLLQDDDQTRVIVLISKPPATSVIERVLEAASATGKPVVVIFVGADYEALQERYGSRFAIARDLTEAANLALQLAASAGATVPTPSAPPVSASPSGSASGQMVGLYSGGTLCDEAMHIWARELGPIYSNIPLEPAWRLPADGRAPNAGHCAIDFGSDEYTRGRPHPMIDPTLRLKRIREEASNPHLSVLLLDIVLGYCAQDDPAAVYAPALSDFLAEARRSGHDPLLVVSLCGTEDDPQRLSVQAAKLREAGAEVFTSNAAAARRCIEMVRRSTDVQE